MPSTWTLTTSHSKAGVTSNLYMADPFQKLPAASDNVQNHTQVTEVVELALSPIRYIYIFRFLIRQESLSISANWHMGILPMRTKSSGLDRVRR
jgi:hypothetical protein